MTRYSRKAEDEVPLKHADQAQRRTRPEDRGPLSPKAIQAIYAKDAQSYPLGMGGKTHEHQPPQDPEDQRDEVKRWGNNGYTNDVPLKGDRAWLRGGGAGHRPGMDTGKFDVSNVPPKPARGLKADGRDMPKSPFSAAHRTYSED